MVIFNHCAAPVLALPLQRQCAMIIFFAKIMQIERNGNELARLHCRDAAYLIQR